MTVDQDQALARLRDLLPAPSVARWLKDARVEGRPGRRAVLRVKGPFEKRWFETHAESAVREVLGDRARVEAQAPARPGPERGAKAPLSRPRLSGPAGEFAVRMVRSFVEGGPVATPLLLLHGPARCGTETLARWALALGGRMVFRLDLARIRGGGSRGLVPRKSLVVAEDLGGLRGRAAAQRSLCTLLDSVHDRGGRVLLTLEGHPADVEGLYPALRSRLLGGVLVPLPAPGPAEVRMELRDRARQRGRRLPRRWEEELQALPIESALRALDLRFDGATDAGVEEVKGPVERMKDVAARAFEVERDALDAPVKRRSVVEARRSIMAAATRAGIGPLEIARAFGITSMRAVREACHWAEREEKRSERFARILHEVGRVVRDG